MNFTYYDLLGVSPEADEQEIRAAFRAAAKKFHPDAQGTSPQFRMFKQAADVLLDPAQRRAYDAGLGGLFSASTKVDTQEPVHPPAGADRPDDRRFGAGAEEPTASTGPGGADADRAETVRTWDGAGEGSEVSEGAAPAGSGASLWAIVTAAVLALVVLVLVGVAAWFGLVQWNFREVRRSSAVADARTASTATAERAAAVILSYDYKTLDADEKAAERYMTSDYAKKYAKTFDKLVRGNATDLHAHVEADVRASGVVNADPDRSAVLLFVDQTTVSKANDGQKQTALNRVEMKMVRQGGRWLVNDITSY